MMDRSRNDTLPLSMQTGVSIVLVLALVSAAVNYGRLAQRVEGMEASLVELSVEVRSLRGLLLKQPA